MAQRNIMRIDLSASARKKLDTLSTSMGMTQLAMMSRMVEWFSEQDAETKGSIMSGYADKNQNKVAHLILHKMTK